jgi:4-hydroxy-tetrahydrodipicolinate synthase
MPKTIPLIRVDVIQGLVCNGHTGEVMSLRPSERARVIALVVKAVADSPRRVKVISGVSAEGSLEGSIMRPKPARPGPTQSC